MRRWSSLMKEFKLLLPTDGKRSYPEFEDKLFLPSFPQQKGKPPLNFMLYIICGIS
jgi:hypothetical protein